jgi:hypothetical protein
MVSRLGGHLGRKGDGPPGAEVLWRGTTKLTHITEAWENSRAVKDVGKAQSRL